MDLATPLTDLDGAIEKLQQIQANLTRFGVRELDVELKNQLESLLCEWRLAQDEIEIEQTMRAVLGLDEPLDIMPSKWTIFYHRTHRNTFQHPSKKHRRLLAAPNENTERRRPTSRGNPPMRLLPMFYSFRILKPPTFVPLSHSSQPPFIRNSKYKLRFISALFSDFLEQKQNGQLGDDDDTIVYDATTTHQLKRYIGDQVIYTTGLINSYYSSCLDGHEKFSALSDDRIWNAFTSGLRLAKEGFLDERLLSKRERMDLNLWVEYMNVE